MNYTYRVFDSIECVDSAAWDTLCAGSAAGIFMDRRFLAAVESGMRAECRLRYVVVDADGAAVCCTCLSTMTGSVADLAEPSIASFIRRMPARLAPLTTIRMLMCGLPVSAGQSSLVFAHGCDLDRALTLVEQVAAHFARADGARLVVFKEFNQRQADRMGRLLQLGYTRVESPPMHTFKRRFKSLEGYRAALRSKYRVQLNSTQLKLAKNGVSVSVVSDPEEMAAIFTADVHQLYLNVVARADMRLETLTREFFVELIRRAGKNVELVVFKKETAVVAVSWLLLTNDAVDVFMVGLRYDLNARLDLYFNIMFASLERALRHGKAEILVGQTAAFFKTRLGCDVEPRYAFAKGVSPIMAWVFRHVLAKLIPAPEPLPALHVFREPE